MKRFIIICGIATIVLCTGVFVLFSLSEPKINVVEEVKAETVTTQPPETEAIAVANIPEPSLLDTAILVYSYYYEDTQSNSTLTTSIPYFLVGMTLEQLTSYFQGWTLDSFSPEKIVIKKNIKSSPEPYYILGIYEGYVTVFYGAPKDGDIKEITSTPVYSLDPSEQKRLEDGIEIIGEERLFKALESYHG